MENRTYRWGHFKEDFSEKSTTKKIRLRLESFSHELLNTACQKILEITRGNNLINNTSVVSLPTNKRIYCVLRSPHVNKDSREHFEIRTHKRIVDIYYDQQEYAIDIFAYLAKTHLPPGVLSSICLL